MQDLSVNDSALADVLAVVATGETVRLIRDGEAVGVVSPPADLEKVDAVAANKEVDRSPGWIMRLREKYDFDKYGVTKEEVDSWRDRSPGREPPFAE